MSTQPSNHLLAKVWSVLLIACLISGLALGTWISGSALAQQTGGKYMAALEGEALPPSIQSDLLPAGQVGGIIYAVETQGNHAYIGIGTKLVVWDITNPAQPTPIGASPILADVVRDIELSGTQAFVAVGEGGVHILDINNPASITELGNFTTYGEVMGVRVVDNYAYVASVFDDFRIFDISNPASPTQVGHYAGIYIAEGLDVVGDYAYVAAGGNGLQIINVSNPISPIWTGSYASTYAREVIVSGNYAYLADGYGDPAFAVINVSNPAAPALSGSYISPGEGYDLALVGSTIYLATWDNGIRIIDVNNPASPSEIGFYNTSGRAEGVAVTNNYAYIADSWDGAKVVNVTNPASPVLVYEYHCAGEAWDVTTDGNVAYLADRNHGFYTIDVSDPSNPQILAYYPKNWYSTSEVYLAVSNNILFAVDRDQLYTFDVSNPSNPTAIGAYADLYDPKGIAIAGDFAYIADGEEGLRILNIQNPAAISQTGILDTPGDLTDLLVSGGYAYLADASQGLRVVNISNPAAPAEVGSYVPAVGYSAGVAITGHYIFLSTGFKGMSVINVSNPNTPTEIGFYATQIGAGIAAVEGYTYVIASQFGATLQQLNVSDPVSPTVTAEYELPLSANRMQIAGSQLHIAAGGGGLMTFPVPLPVSLKEVRPYQGTSDWANEVHIYGQNLDANATFSLVPLTPAVPVVLDSEQIDSTHFVAIIPAGLAAENYDLQVVNPDGGQATLVNAYQVLDPLADTLYAYSDELWAGPTAPIVYEDTLLGLVVHRAGGSSDITNLSVDFYDGDPNSGGDIIGSGSIAALPPDSFTSTAGILWTPTTDGFHEIYARVNTVTPFTVHRPIWVLPPALDLIPPTVNSVVVNNGETDVSTGYMTISIQASDNTAGSGVGNIYIMEFDWNPNMGEWIQSNESGWVDYTGTPTSYGWTLSWSPGVKNIVVWAADRAGNISTYGHVTWINFIPPAMSVNQGQFHMFSYWLTSGQSFNAQATPSSGDPDLYLGDANGWYAHSINAGTVPDSISVSAPSSGLHTLAVYGWTTARYALNISDTRLPTSDDGIAAPTGDLLTELAQPPSESGAPNQRALPPAPTGFQVYLPTIIKR